MPKKILVMDDELCMRMALDCVLQNWGCSVSLTSNGQEAIECFASAKNQGTPFDAVILDVMVHNGLGGVEALQTIRKFEPNTLAIAISGNGQHPVIRHPAHYGFKGSLEKPFEADDLKRLLGPPGGRAS